MKHTFKNKFLKNHLLWLIAIFFCCIGLNAMSPCMTVHASYIDEGEALDSYPIPGLQFSEHAGMKASIHGNPLYCTQKGYPFRSMVSEMQMLRGATGGTTTGSKDGKFSFIVGYLDKFNGMRDYPEYYRGWGVWEMNSDFTDAALVDNSNAPSSDERSEDFERYKLPDEAYADDENSKYANRYQNTGNVRRFIDEVGGIVPDDWTATNTFTSLLTGHEGTRDTFPVRMKKISYTEAGYDMPRVYAGGMMDYYVWEGYGTPNSEYDYDTRFRVTQAITWALEKNKITSMGYDGSLIRVIYNQGADELVQKYIKTYYESMKLYRQVVWKTTNMRQVPSFSRRINGNGYNKPIKLYWDETQKLYTATVSDQNGVLDYFDFELPGCTVTNNGDGTLTISTPNQIPTPVTSKESQSKIEPPDGVFKLPVFYRWTHEGTTRSFTYTVMRAKGRWFNDAEGRNGQAEGYEGDDHRQTRGRLQAAEAHSLDYAPRCSWYCTTPWNKVTHCTMAVNYCFGRPNCGKSEHSHGRDCYGITCGNHSVLHSHTKACEGRTCNRESHSHSEECHSHDRESDKCHNCYQNKDGTEYIECQHQWTCPYILKEKAVGYATVLNTVMPNTGEDACDWQFGCSKLHYEAVTKTVEGQYADWQDMIEYAEGRKIIDPELCYIQVETVPHEFPAETDAEILLIADNPEWNNLTYNLVSDLYGTIKPIKYADHVRVGEKYHLKYIYSYKGASKGFKINFTLQNKPYYQYSYLARMYAPQNAQTIYGLRTASQGVRGGSIVTVPHAVLDIDPTKIKIRGLYSTPETAYTANGAYTWDSKDTWNDSVKLDALTTDQFDDNYNNMAADDYVGANVIGGGGEKILSSNKADEKTKFSVSKKDDEMLAIWEYDTKPEVFSSALISATAYIEIEKNDNFTQTYYDEAYNYAKDSMPPTILTNWNYDKNAIGDHNNAGGVGYFSSEYSDPNGTQTTTPIPSHTIFTRNNEYMTYALRNKVWQSDLDIQVSNFKQNTGAGITQHIMQGRENEKKLDWHAVNYNLYYTIDVVNPKAAMYESKQKVHDGMRETPEVKTTNYDTSGDVNEFDINTKISWYASGAAKTSASEGSTTTTDHIKTGRTYIQREIPTVLATMENRSRESMRFTIYPNFDRLIYEDHYTGVTESGTEAARRVGVFAKSDYYPSNEQSAASDIYSAMNPNSARPLNIQGSDNVPDMEHQSDDVLRHKKPTTSFNIRLSNGQSATVRDSDTKGFTEHYFRFNEGSRNNRYAFPSHRRSITFYKYSKTSYDGLQGMEGAIGSSGASQTESYYISQVLFKSNYTTKYKKELQEKGAKYVEDKVKTTSGDYVTDSWIDMANQNKFAIVSAGQGFELRVTVKYENSKLTQYLARYFEADDAQNDNDSVGTQNQRYHIGMTGKEARQFCNISALIGTDGRDAPYYKASERAYISHESILDKLAVSLVTGSNVYNDLYCFMSDNPNTVYSYSGIYDTPVIFERDIKYSEDYSVTTVTYTMCVSKANGIASSMQKMKFYTDQLAPDKKTPGIVEGNYDVLLNKEHSVTLWTPIVAATPLAYPNESAERYIGDAIELGYTIKTTAVDDSIVHIIQ